MYDLYDLYMVDDIFSLWYNLNIIQVQVLRKKGLSMPLTEAQKRANKKYQAKAIASVACRVKREQAEKFREYCSGIGKTPNAVVREYVLQCIGETTTETD